MSFDQDRECSGILVVEDDSDIAEALTFVLEEEGHKVIIAKNGAQALEFLRAHTIAPPCVILLDLMMPEMNGIEFRREQLRDPILATVPVVLVTADRAAQLYGDEMKVAATILKPLDVDDLISLVSRYC